jgi:Zn-dependent peptidase ImmA (M78 family)/transcriptional regulator with XRE-family HTH domain
MIGSRLKRAREASGYSLRELEAAIGGQVSAQAIGKYERNEMMPGSKVLMALARALEVSPEYLLSTREIELAGVDFRKAPHASSKEEKAVESAVLDQVERYLELEELFPRSMAQWSMPEDMKDFLVRNIDDAETAADLLRKAWELGIDAIPSMAELLEDKGLKVIALDLSVNVSGSKALIRRPDQDDVPVIVVNSSHNGERQRFTLAHELAHLVLRPADGLDEEKLADRFAGAFLMAREMLLRIVGENRTSISLGELAELKKIFKVSIASIAVRCHQVGALTKAAYGRIWGQIKALGWNSQNSSEPNQLEKEIPQRMERLCLRAVSEGAISISKAAELLRKSVFDFEKLLLGQGV